MTPSSILYCLRCKVLIQSLPQFTSNLPLVLGRVQFSSVTQLSPTLCDPVNHSSAGLPVHHQLLEFTQTHVHRIGDAIQPSHPLSSPLLRQVWKLCPWLLPWPPLYTIPQAPKARPYYPEMVPGDAGGLGSL